jgi:hypothetical protein
MSSHDGMILGYLKFHFILMMPVEEKLLLNSVELQSWKQCFNSDESCVQPDQWASMTNVDYKSITNVNNLYTHQSVV